MALYVIGDTHLSLSVDKSMDIFGGWHNYMERLEENWRANIMPGDTVVIPGDVSWAMSLQEAKADFAFLHSLPGEKILLKGNHDYWWTTKRKMDSFLEENNFHSLRILSNNSFLAEGAALCGTRGWIFEQGQPQDKKIVQREAGRLRLSLDYAAQYFPGAEQIVFLHYPPVFGSELTPEILDVLLEYKIKRCFYGHIHGQGCGFALIGAYCGIDFQLVSGDFLRFNPKKVK